jgi:hypothetical protein
MIGVQLHAKNGRRLGVFEMKWIGQKFLLFIGILKLLGIGQKYGRKGGMLWSGTCYIITS